MEYDVKEIQKKILTIYEVFKSICEKNNLSYFAIGGTCLGAVRHGGFIPWDDDMDVAMPREDYEKFKEIAKVEFPEQYELYDIYMGEHYISYFCKMMDKNTTFVEEGMKKYKDMYFGFFLDIMPLDGIPNNKIVRKIHFAKMKVYRALDIRRKYKNYFWLKMFPCHYFQEKYEKQQKKYKFEQSRDLSYTWSARRDKVIFSRSCFDGYVEMPFEDTTVRCPVGYDEFLKAVFGDYMLLPPKEAQTCVHKLYIIDFNKPYRSYWVNEGES